MNLNMDCPFDHEHGKDDFPVPCQAGAVSMRKVIPYLVMIQEVLIERIDVLAIAMADRIIEEGWIQDLHPGLQAIADTINEEE